jgi:tRNA threonylcarbamoyladenosine biosynthesis protein TsaE
MQNREWEEGFFYELPEVSLAAKLAIKAAEGFSIWCFNGEMGAGKTTLVSKICEELQVVSEVSSPSFSIVNEYETLAKRKVYHFDFYRIKSIEEVYDIGYEEYFDSGEICLIEWPEKIAELLETEHHISFEIKHLGVGRQLRKA